MKSDNGKLATMLAAALLAGRADGQTVDPVVIDDQTFDRIFPAPTPGQVTVSMAVGELIVRGWDQDEIEVSGELGEDALRVELTLDEGQMLINVVPVPEGTEPAYGGETDIFVRMPRQSSLTFSTTDAEGLIAGIHGSQSLHTISGDIETEFWSGPITAESASGDLAISNRTGFGAPGEVPNPDLSELDKVVLTTLSGEIEARGPFSQLTASTVSGDIELDVANVSMLQLETSNGDIEVQATLSAGAEVNAETINGDVELDIGEEGNLTLDLGSFSGRIENCFGYEDLPSSSGSGRELRIDGPDNSPSIRARTLNGDIEICAS